MNSTRRACGIAAGPVFLAVWAAQAFTRDGFEPGKHPISRRPTIHLVYPPA